MTEAEWLACTDPRPMVLHLRQEAGERKLRYFAFACVRRLWDKVPAEALKRAIEASERHADGLIDDHELGVAITAANRARPSRHRVARAAYDAARYTPGLGFSGVHWDSVTMLLARAAAQSGARYLLVDALPTSQPILQRLGFRRIADTWPCEWTRADSDAK